VFFSLFRPIVRALIATSDFAPFSQSSDLKKFSLFVSFSAFEKREKEKPRSASPPRLSRTAALSVAEGRCPERSRRALP